MSNFCRCGCRNNTAYELCSLCRPDETGNEQADENDIAALILSAEVEDGITVTDLLQHANFALGERMNFGIRLAQNIIAAPSKAQP